METLSTKSLLVIEDSDEDFIAMQRIIGKLSVTLPVYHCVDAEDALDFLYHQGEYTDQEIAPRPSVIMLDLNLPGTDGLEVLAQIKQDEQLKMIPVVVFTTSSNPKDIESCYNYGANGYMIKPIDVIKLEESIRNFINYWFKVVTLVNALEHH
jgi:CheY-like chemotaxis protein